MLWRVGPTLQPKSNQPPFLLPTSTHRERLGSSSQIFQRQYFNSLSSLISQGPLFFIVLLVSGPRILLFFSFYLRSRLWFQSPDFSDLINYYLLDISQKGCSIYGICHFIAMVDCLFKIFSVILMGIDSCIHPTTLIQSLSFHFQSNSLAAYFLFLCIQITLLPLEPPYMFWSYKCQRTHLKLRPTNIIWLEVTVLTDQRQSCF